MNRAVTIDEPETTNSAALDRDWAAASGGAEVTDFTGPDYGPGCNADAMIDLSYALGWSTTADLVDGVAGPDTPKQVTIQLPEPVDVSSITVDPTANCGDGPSASTGAFRVEVSTDGTAFTEVSDGEFSADDLGQANEVPLTGSTDGVLYVRYWIDAPLVLVDTDAYGEDACSSGGDFSGCDYQDAVELEVYGAPAA